jgi:hypothetical protein
MHAMGDPLKRTRPGTSIALALSLAFLGSCTHRPPAIPDACPAPARQLAFDLHVPARDANGLPLGPVWVAQQQGPRFAGAYCRPDPDQLCGGFPTDAPVGHPQGRPKCNSSATVDLPSGFHAFVCSLETFIDGRDDKLRGHVNWMPVTYEGFLDWGETSPRPPFGDADVTLALTPVEVSAKPLEFAARRAGLTPYPEGGPMALITEFKATEVSDFFDHTWWSEFRDQARDDENAAMQALPTTRFAVVTGVLGLDAEHKGHAELHPVYALALQTRCTTEDQPGTFSTRWAVFARNWGNEGYCSSYRCEHHLLLDAAGTFTFRLPLGDVRDVSAVELVTGPGATEVWANDPAVGVGQKVETDPGGRFALVRLHLPAPERAPLVYGEIVLRFKGTGAAGCPIDPRSAVGATGSAAVTPPNARRPEGAEALLARIGAELPAEERTRLERSLVPREPLASRSFMPVEPVGELTPAGPAELEDPIVCPPALPVAREADAERAAVCSAAKGLPQAAVARDKRLAALLRECSR